MRSRKTATCYRCGEPCYPSTVAGKLPACHPCSYHRDTDARMNRLGAAVQYAEAGRAFREQFCVKRCFEYDDTGLPYDVISYEIKTDRPVILMGWADWHLGSDATDHREWLDTMRAVVASENMYIFTLGDLIENTRLFRSLEAVHAQTIGPNEQLAVLDETLSLLTEAGKLLFSVGGNHDVTRDERLFAYSPVAKMLAERTRYFRGKGIFRLRVGEAEYQLFVSHSAGNSKINPFHAPLTMFREFPYADFYASAHTHKTATGWFSAPDGRRIGLMQLGTHKKDDLYSMRYFRRGAFGAAAIVVFPDGTPPVLFDSADDAAVYLRGLK